MMTNRTYITMNANHYKADSVTSYGFDPTDSHEGCNSLIWIPKSQVQGWLIEGRTLSFSLPTWMVNTKRLKERLSIGGDAKFTDGSPDNAETFPQALAGACIVIISFLVFYGLTGLVAGGVK